MSEYVARSLEGDQVPDLLAVYVEVWHCPITVYYQVIREEWDLTTTPPTRHIYEVDPA